MQNEELVKQTEETLKEVMFSDTVVRAPAPRQPRVVHNASTEAPLPPFLTSVREEGPPFLTSVTEEGKKVGDDSSSAVHVAQHSRKTHRHIDFCSLGSLLIPRTATVGPSYQGCSSHFAGGCGLSAV